MNKQSLIRIILSLLIILYFYTALSKMLDLEDFSIQMHNQTFSPTAANILVWLIPTIEIAVVAMLLVPAYRLAGLYGSTILMTAFTTYICLVLLDFFDRHPCSCGGVISTMSFELHLIFNLFFLMISLLGIYIIKKQQKLQKPQ